MTIIRNLKRSTFLLALLGAIPLCAQSPYSFDLKIHGGVTGGSLHTDLADNKTFGFGVEGRYSLGGTKALTAELSYDAFGSRWRDVPPPSATIYALPAGGAPVTTWNGGPLVLTNANSMDLRKESVQGFSLRGGYTDALPWIQGLTWKAGLSLDTYKVISEFTGTLIPSDANGNAFDDGSGKDYYEGWAISKSKVKVGLGAYVGVGMPLNEDLRIEFNLRSVATGHSNYHPFTYTGKPASMEDKSRQSVVFEIALALKL
ncbi:hypothetical protein [Geothrix sp. PMB-07]|uniref:hypothetical protein n=1 Tax=Geothrix sp. PMB-07 TaxID=3068640 RepID=UPI00274092FA|nr:hypothetical protein [Geothrix sp. PMB-07]WLT30676.1 hypothetical protein Q9293_13225 [Geothrix sp. PMB-07]